MTDLKFPHLTFAAIAVTSALFAADTKPSVVVAADGSGDFTTIQAAVVAAPCHGSAPPWIIRIKPGIYNSFTRPSKFYAIY